MSKFAVIAIGVITLAIVAEFMREQLTPKPVQTDASGIEYNTATWDNSFYATSQVQAYGAFQPQTPAVPNSPYAWSVYQSVNGGGQ